VRVKRVRRHPNGPAIKLLTPYQGNRTRVEVKTVRRHPAGHAMNHSHPVKATGPEWE